MTGGRLKRVLEYVGDEDFCFTYGDGVADIDITALVAFHREQGTQRDRDRRAAARALRRARHRRRAGARVRGEAARGRRLDERRLLRALARRRSATSTATSTVWEQEPMRALARDGQLACYRHEGFWQAMDTLRDRNQLEELWRSGRAPWRDVGLARVSAPADADAGRRRRPSTPDFWRDRRVLLTGHTGFKGAWLALWLQSLGRARDGLLATACPREPSLYRARAGRRGHGERRGRRARPGRRWPAALAAARARGRDPHGGPVARAPLLRRAARDV